MKSHTESQLRFIISTLVWAMLLMAAYAATAHAQTGAPSDCARGAAATNLKIGEPAPSNSAVN